MFEAMIDPTATPTVAAPADPSPLAPRRASLDGLIIGLLANTKVNAEPLLTEIAALLERHHGTSGVVRRTKHSITDPVPPATLAELTAQCDVVVVGVGDCGSCSASAITDGCALEAAGIPAAVICTEAFTASADAMAELQGSPGYRYVRIPHPLALLDRDGVRERAEQALPEIVGILTADLATATA